MGQPDQFAKRTFAEETAFVTRGAVAWQDPPEIGLIKIQGDGLLCVVRPDDLAGLAPPWPEARAHEEVLIELKMPGDHLDVCAVQRALLRRQARQVQRAESTEPRWTGEEPIWVVAPHVPEVLQRIREVRQFAPGCYAVKPSAFSFLWVAANELPLREELVPFLVARSGRALEAFAWWVAARRPSQWVLDMVQYTTMSDTLRDEILRRYGPVDDPEVMRRRRHIVKVWLDMDPGARQELLDEGRLLEARGMLHRVLARRGLPLTQDEADRIEACADLPTLERWIEQAATATTTAEALG